jgi:hypothetical protein
MNLEWIEVGLTIKANKQYNKDIKPNNYALRKKTMKKHDRKIKSM